MREKHPQKTDKIVIVGDSAFAQIAYEYFKYDSPYEVVAFSVEKKFLKRKKVFELPVVPFEQLEDFYDPSQYKIFIAVTYTKLNMVRARLYKEAKKKGYTLVSYISSKAFVWRNVEIGDNCFIFEDNTIQPFVKVGDDVIFWSGNHIGHHSIIKDHCFISSHVVISGFCEIGKYCFLGVNSTISNNIKIADKCLIGAGVTILKDTKEEAVYGSTMPGPKDYDSSTYFGVEENIR